jgi:competence protein ComEC
MRDPLLVPACLFAAGIAFARAEWVTGGTAAGLAALAGMLSLGGSLMGRRWAYLACGWLALFLAGQANMALRSKAAPPGSGAAGRQTLEGCVVGIADAGEQRLRIEVETGRLGGVQVSAPVEAGRPEYGDYVRGEANVRAVRNLGLEGAFDRETFLSRKGLFWQASMTTKGRWSIRKASCGNAVVRRFHRIRRSAGERLGAMFGSEPQKEGLLKALLLGDGAALRRSWVGDFRRTGTYHALVISGGHITVICGIFLWWRRRIGWGCRTAVAASAAVAWFYSAVAGGATPSLRAAAAMTLAAVGYLIFRSPRLLNILAAVTLIFLAIDPGQLFEASFQLSFLAVAAIGLLAQPWAPGRERSGRLPDSGEVELGLLAGTLALAAGGTAERWRAALRGAVGVARWTAQALLVSAAVQVGLLLPMVIYFHRLSVTGLVANIVVTPIVSLAIPAGFLALVTGNGAAAGAAGWLIGQAQRLAGLFARWEPHWPVPDPPAWLAAAFVMALLLAVLCLGRSRRAGAVPLAAALALAGVIVAHPFPPRQTAGELEVTLLDTGQSESLLLGLPQGGFVLVDAAGASGRPAARGRFDPGEDLIAPYLWQRGIRRLEAMVLTHLHEDHAGGAPYLIRSFRPRALWTGYAPDHPGWRNIEGELRAAGGQIHLAQEGSRWNWGSVSVRALAPSPEQRWRGKPSNNDSLILLLAYGRRQILLAGDAERGVGDRLAEDGLLERVDVLKVPHHGAKSALSRMLLEKTKPALALISAGWQNSFGFPHPETLEALRSQGSIPLRTDIDGSVTVRSDGRGLSYETFGGSSPR